MDAAKDWGRLPHLSSVQSKPLFSSALLLLLFPAPVTRF